MLDKLKYLSIFALPFTVYIAFTSGNLWTYLPAGVFYGVVPALELFLTANSRNLNEKERESALHDSFYDWVLYLMVPLQIIYLLFFFHAVQSPGLSTFELIGRISSMGIMCGVTGINIGHELGHRSLRVEQFLGEILLLTSLEMHFLPYHNRGHHFNVATPGDPATAKRGESVFVFWVRSQFGSYLQAWQFESSRLRKKGIHLFSFQNKMIIYTLYQVSLLMFIYFIYGLFVMLAFITAAMIGILLLETVNYIEHYGLQRKKNKNGNYERVMRHHSWNSDHAIGRSMLFELSRHSDHHYKASKHYQILDSLPQSPQMPTGYPGMMLLALIPPLWFSVMHTRLQNAGDLENDLLQTYAKRN